MKEGAVYQIKGPFKSGENVLSDIYSKEGATGAQRIRFGISLDEKDWLPLARTFSFTVTGIGSPVTVLMGRSHIYEIDDGVYVSSIAFNQDAPESTKVNFIVCE